ncbi:response regulator [Heliobacillus mobilis]|uniref:Stage 0 sporulation protein A homolog n=1 Tax=Heliobacterium mobile TaxID=28064 RepID=Q0PIH0_HELMO|nr:response regulator [Heliobacterium mobile]ABH04847.1 CheY/Spo0F [Heliobacterium mobile]MTV49783.1 response regulator [Heliobacterium mobile]
MGTSSDKKSENGKTIIQTDNSSVTVLLVEDNLMNQKLMKILLNKLGYKVDCVNNGLESLTAVTEHQYSLILMDIQMPIMDGLEATRNIRKNEHQYVKNTPIIAVSANRMDEYRDRCFAAGMNDYISKPIEIDELKTKLNYFLSKNCA